MSEKKGWGTTVLGWFVVRDGEEAAGGDHSAASTDAGTDALIAKYAQAPEAAPSPVTFADGVPLPATAGEAIDFPGVYRAAGLDDEEQGRIDKATALLRTLPLETPKEVKRQIVEASLKAFGYPLDQIIEAGAGEIQALQGYIELGQRKTQSLLGEGTTRLAKIEKEAAEVKLLMEETVKRQYELTNACNEQKLKVQEVLEFFGQDAVARVVRDSPKLHEPATTGRK
ncbi:MAG: hypothetical protein EXR72_18740 [Myxococcales bacterium]|nr:hypothetical protein [Myxococcales bacterium]